jgi:hypothetical protein
MPPLALPYAFSFGGGISKRGVVDRTSPYAKADSPCGRCSSCLHRAAALQHAGMAPIDSSRIGGDGETGRQTTSAKRSVAATAHAVSVARNCQLLSSDDPYRAFDAEYPRIDEARAVAAAQGISDDSFQEMIVNLYREHCHEMGTFLGVDPVALPRQVERAVAS